MHCANALQIAHYAFRIMHYELHIANYGLVEMIKTLLCFKKI